MQTGTFLHKDRLTLRIPADISALGPSLMSAMTAAINQTREESSRDTDQKNSAMRRKLMSNGAGHGEEAELEHRCKGKCSSEQGRHMATIEACGRGWEGAVMGGSADPYS